MKRRLVSAAVLLLVHAAPVSGQRLLEEWRVRPEARPEALTRGAAAVFWNPAQVRLTEGRGEATVLDLHTPSALSVDGAGVAATYALDPRTTIALGIERVGIDGIIETTNSPEGIEMDIGETRLAAAAAHAVGTRAAVGALVQYTRLPDVSDDGSVLALGAGVSYRAGERFPLEVAGMAAIEGEDHYWMAGAEVASGQRWPTLTLRGAYGAAGGSLAPGVTHRVVATGEWRRLLELSLGAASEPGATGRTTVPVVGAAVRLGRYRIGAVREQLPNDFGSAWSFRFTGGFQ